MKNISIFFLFLTPFIYAHSSSQSLSVQSERSSSSGLTDGFYLGVGMGVSLEKGRRDMLIDDIPAHTATSFFTSKKNKTSFLPSVSVGYLSVFDNAFAGIDVGIEGGYKKSKVSGSSIYRPGLPMLGSFSYSGQFQQHYALHLISKLGVLLNKSTGVYVKAGPVLGKFSFKGNVQFPLPFIARTTHNIPLKYKKHTWGGEVGFGVIHHYNSDWLLSFDYGYRWFKTIRHDFERTPGELTEITVKPRQHHLMMTVSYTF